MYLLGEREPDDDLFLDLGDGDGVLRLLDDRDLWRRLGDLEADRRLLLFGDGDDLPRDLISVDFFLIEELLSLDLDLDLCLELFAWVLSLEEEGFGSGADSCGFAVSSFFSVTSGTGMSAVITLGKMDIGFTTPI